jgi:two-component system chemotaxis response regulator CheY
MSELKVLVADNTASVRQFIKYALEDHFPGVDIEMANSGKNIQQRLDNARYDLIIYDKDMPMLDGNTLLEWLRKHETLKKTPFILMSADGDEESLKKAVQSGTDAYLLKPFKIDNLVHKVTSVVNMLNRRRSERYRAEGEVILRTSSQNFKVKLIDLSSEGFSGMIDRQERLPHILEKVEAGIELQNRKKIAGMSGYIIRMEAIEAEHDIEQIKIAVKIVEDAASVRKKELADLLSSLAH